MKRRFMFLFLFFSLFFYSLVPETLEPLCSLSLRNVTLLQISTRLVYAEHLMTVSEPAATWI